MSVRVITARRSDRCRECSGAIAVGARINYGGPGAVTHEDCRPLAVMVRGRGRRVYGGYESTGRRCEDAPCCGCC
jgi:hypothetical protein